jgi:hypothetical protein
MNIRRFSAATCLAFSTIACTPSPNRPEIKDEVLRQVQAYKDTHHLKTSDMRAGLVIPLYIEGTPGVAMLNEKKESCPVFKVSIRSIGTRDQTTDTVELCLK